MGVGRNGNGMDFFSIPKRIHAVRAHDRYSTCALSTTVSLT
jgi:hypothetical protein